VVVERSKRNRRKMLSCLGEEDVSYYWTDWQLEIGDENFN
jgi:hypothetical protein